MSENNVTSINGEIASLPFRQSVARDVAETCAKFEAAGDKPTGAVWVVFDDKGSFRTGWCSEYSELPATAIIGMAIGALTRLDR